MAIHTITEAGTEITFAGCVLRAWIGECQYMSDVYGYALYAEVYDNGAVRKIQADNDWSNAIGAKGWAFEDASDDVRLAVLRAEAYKRIIRAFEQNALKAELAHNAPTRGKIMRSTTTRGKNKGLQGICFWIGANRYGEQVGIALSDKRDVRNQYVDVAWLAADKCQNVEPFPAQPVFCEETFEVVVDKCQNDGIHGVDAFCEVYYAMYSERYAL